MEHDVTFDLFTQIARRERTLSAAWDAFRWRRFETRAFRRFPQVVVMSEKDAEMAGVPSTLIPNGVDLPRYGREADIAGLRRRLDLDPTRRYITTIASSRTGLAALAEQVSRDVAHRGVRRRSSRPGAPSPILGARADRASACSAS